MGCLCLKLAPLEGRPSETRSAESSPVKGRCVLFSFCCEIMPNTSPQRTSTCVFVCLWATAVLTVVLVVLLGGEIGENKC